MEIQRACNANLLMPARNGRLTRKGKIYSARGDLRLSSNKHANSAIRARPEEPEEETAEEDVDRVFPITRPPIARPRRS